MSPDEALQFVLNKLEENGIEYMLTGSFASNMHGVPRTTYDADIVIEVEPGALEELVRSLGDGFYVSAEAAREAVSRRSMFNVIHLETGFKVDFIVRKIRPFSKKEFSRREKGAFLGESRWFATPEDVILAKLEWSKLGESERQFLDAVNVAKVQGEKLDRSYLEKWAKELGIQELVKRLLDELSE
ncbi:MAG: hypothetical protein R6V46_02290 [Desulfatiglandaceae bacterium]